MDACLLRRTNLPDRIPPPTGIQIGLAEIALPFLADDPSLPKDEPSVQFTETGLKRAELCGHRMTLIGT